MNLRKPFVLVAALGATAAMPAVASAGTASATLAVSATVTNNCTISTTPLSFGTYDPVATHASANLDGTATVVITCTKGAAATIGLDGGANAAGAVRRMANGGVFLNYEVYKENSRATVWGNAGSALLDAGSAPSSAPQTFTVFGRVTGGQTGASAGSYTDTITATVNF